MKLALALF